MVIWYYDFFLANSNLILQISHAFKMIILGTSTIILSKDIDKYAGSNYNETDVNFLVGVDFLNKS